MIEKIGVIPLPAAIKQKRLDDVSPGKVNKPDAPILLKIVPTLAWSTNFLENSPFGIFYGNGELFIKCWRRAYRITSSDFGSTCMFE